MFFQLSEEHLAVRDAARDFAQLELKPGVIERDSKMQYPTEQVRKMSELGFMGMMVDLKSMTSGTASFEMSFDHYDPISGKVADDVIKSAQTDNEEG